VHVPAAASYGKLALPGLCHSFLVAAVWSARAEALAVANGKMHHNCSSVDVDTAVSAAAVAADAVGVGEVASIGRSAAGVFACSARRVSAALEEEQAVPARGLAKLMGLVCRV
jgi:hypothetical protein